MQNPVHTHIHTQTHMYVHTYIHTYILHTLAHTLFTHVHVHAGCLHICTDGHTSGAFPSMTSASSSVSFTPPATPIPEIEQAQECSDWLSVVRIVVVKVKRVCCISKCYNMCLHPAPITSTGYHTMFAPSTYHKYWLSYNAYIFDLRLLATGISCINYSMNLSRVICLPLVSAVLTTA